MRRKTQLKFHKNQQGIVSVVLTVFVLIVLSLIVIAFSQNSRREQRQSLDRQLSTQAFYAAESGVNTAISEIRKGPTGAFGNTIEYTKCSDGAAQILDSAITNGGQKAFSVPCLLFDRAPTLLQFSSIDTSQGEFFSLQTLNNDLNKVKVSWTKSDAGGGNYSGCVSAGSAGTIPASATDPAIANCGAGIIRILMIPVSNNGTSREKLYNDSYTVYLRPTKNASDAAAQTSFEFHSSGADTQGKIIPAKCTAGGRCEATINGMPAGGSVYMQIRSVYFPNAVDISGQNIAGQPVRFNQAQIKIDVTGKATDVLRRVQVRMPLYESYTSGGGGASASVLDVMQGLCKRLGVYPAIGGNPAAGGIPSGVANNDECTGIGL